MTIKQAIDKSIIEGWFPQQKAQFIITKNEQVQIGEHFVLDPSFWQSLGKALGWNQNTCKCCNRKEEYCLHETPNGINPEWQWRMVNLMRQISENRSIKSYFKEL